MEFHFYVEQTNKTEKKKKTEISRSFPVGIIPTVLKMEFGL